MPNLRRANVLFKGQRAGTIEETESGYRFTYDPGFVDYGHSIAVSLPLRAEPFESARLFPFFEGLLPEGWYKEIVCRTIKVDEDDSFGLLIHACADCVGAVSLEGESS
ncbi:MAG: HipA N-terminal domain-containing protein [Verrucomicrobia bacterium]|nr:HipA N-terminal domain-containing protein [Verrucomicrobiota bacterium]MDA1085850.1 HipA N-terminal domain-containing protein [Verrucomicrobiota bacterium]